MKKNGILQVDATNQLRDRGHVAARGDHRGQSHPAAADSDDHRDARGRHGPHRPRPGPGAGARASMAKVIIGGQMLSLLLALIVTPVFYVLLDSFGSFLHRIGVRFAVEQTPSKPPVHDAPPSLAKPTHEHDEMTEESLV